MNEQSDAAHAAERRRAEQVARVAAMVASERGYTKRQALAVYQAVHEDLTQSRCQDRGTR